MTRPRPYIPLSVRVQVAERQVRESGSIYWSLYQSAVSEGLTMGMRLTCLLSRLRVQGIEYPQLDHDPALILRKFSERTGRYTPDANDPDYLIYRSKEDHLKKTTGRNPGALKTITTKGSDIGLKTKFARLEKKAAKGKRRGAFPKGRKLQSRPFNRGASR